MVGKLLWRLTPRRNQRHVQCSLGKRSPWQCWKRTTCFSNLWLSTLSWKYLTLHSQLEIFDLRFPLTNLDEALPQPRSRTTPPWSKARLSKCEKGNFQFKVNLFEGCGDSFEFRQCHPTLGLSCIDLCVGLLYKVAKLAWKYHETLLYPCLCRNDAEMINTKSQW